MALKPLYLNKTNMRYVICFLIITSFTVNAQDLSTYQWKNRIVLVIGKSSDHSNFKNQLQLLKNHTVELENRKLVVFQITPNSFKEGIKETTVEHKSTELYNTYATQDENFEVILIGLDGGIKLRVSEIVTTKSLFSTIDRMPMRRSELNRNDQP